MPKYKLGALRVDDKTATSLKILAHRRMDVDPREYASDQLEDFRIDWLHTNLLSKYPHGDDSLRLSERKASALSKFAACESSCKTTNERVIFPSPIWGVEAIISMAQRKIEKVLGRLNLEDVFNNASFSSGASTRLKRYDSLPPSKFFPEFKGVKHKPQVTADCLPYAITAVKGNELWAEFYTQLHGPDPLNWFDVIVGNRLTTVPKNSQIERCIAIEPCMNMYVQKGVGNLIRSKLKPFEIDLNTQFKNQFLAYEGSISGNLATIDLSSASDCISLGVCELLLPSEWFQLLVDLRSHYGTLPDGKLVRYEKISSMGNGFTFELESLLFYGIVSAVRDICSPADRRLAVYGDDLIVGTECVNLLHQGLTFLGFSFNQTKSFHTGHFRESCGKHFFSGFDVTPFYIKDRINSIPRLFWLCNSFRRWALRSFDYYEAHDHKTWRRLRHLLPSEWRNLTIPEGFGDVGLLSFRSEACIKQERSSFCMKVLQPQERRRGCTQKGLYLANLGQAIRSSDHSGRDEKGVRIAESDLARALASSFRLIRIRTSVWVDPHGLTFCRTLGDNLRFA